MENSNPYVMALITQIGVVCTSLFTLIGIIIQVRAGSKQKKNDDLVKSIDTKLDTMRQDSERSDKELRSCMEDHHLRYYKDQLVTTMSRIENGYVPTTEEKHVLHEQKAKYNELGGDSYVDEMWDKLIKKDLI